MKIASSLALAALLATLGSAHAQTTLYQQDFEHPVGFHDDGGDINIFRTVNQLYGNQPAGFTFWQPYTDETLYVGGNEAFGTGYKDPQHIAGHYVVGMLSDLQDDRLSMSFSVGNYQFLNFGLDISSIDLDRFGGPFVPAGAVPTFRFTLWDNPSGTTGQQGDGVMLDSATATGVAAADQVTFDWTHAVLGLNAAGATNGNVTLEIDLLSGAGYAALDNFDVVASNEKGVIPGVPEPGSWALMALGLAVIATRARAAARSA